MTIALAAVCACSNPSSQQGNRSTSATAHKHKELEATLAELEKRTSTLEIDSRLRRNLYQTGVFDPADSSFQRIDAPDGFGSFAVSIDDVRPFGDGVKVTLNLGNLSTASFLGVELDIRYGVREPASDTPDFFARYGEWIAAQKSKKETLTKELTSGNWNPVTVALPDIASDSFGYLEVSLKTRQISLSKR